MDVGIRPALSQAIVPVVDDGHAMPAMGDGPAENAFGSALVSALGDDGATPASSAAAAPKPIRPGFSARLRGDSNLAEATAPSDSMEDITPSPTAVVLDYLGLEWPPDVRPAGFGAAGGTPELDGAPGELSGPEAQTVPTDAAVIPATLDVGVGVPPALVNPAHGRRQTGPVGDSRGFDLRNGPALPAHGLRPAQLLSRFGLSGGEPRPTASARAGSVEGLVDGGSAFNTDAAAAAGTESTASGVRPTDLVGSGITTPQGADAPSPTLPSADARLPVSDTPARLDDQLTAFAASPSIVDNASWNGVPSDSSATNPAEVATVPEPARGIGADTVGPGRGLPAFVRAALGRQPVGTTTPTAERRGTSQPDGQHPTFGAVDPTQVPGQGARASVPTISQAGPRIRPVETATAGPRDASRIEAQRQIGDAFVLAQQSVQNASTHATRVLEAPTNIVPTLSADRPIADRKWTGGPQEEIATAVADLVRGVGATAAHSGTAGQSTGRDESNGRAFERRPPADVPSLYTALTRGATADIVSERGTFNAAARAMAEPTMAEPAADGAPLAHALVQSLKLQWRQGGGEARLHLQPEYLGELTVSLRVQGSAVTAVLQCDSQSVRAWVEAHQAELRRALEEQGLSLDALTVDPEGHPQPQQEQSRPHEDQPRKKRSGDPVQFEAFL